MPQDAASYLRIYLEPCLAQLERPDVTDIYINAPGELWAETLGGATEHHLVPDLTEGLLWRLARQVASLTHQGISREHPLLAARLPDGARIQFVAPPATRGPMAVAIRKHVSADMMLADFAAAGAFSQTRGNAAADPADAALRTLHDAGDWAGFLAAAVRARKTVIVSGGTSTGKTTFLNALLREVPPRERLVLIEDTPELVLRHDNAIGLVAVRGALGEAAVTALDLLTASLRLRPDRIILGELRGGEAFAFLRAINTGHPGSLTTIHADSPDGAVEQLAMLVLQDRGALKRSDVVDYIGRIVDVVVQLSRHSGHRAVSEVRWREAGEV